MPIMRECPFCGGNVKVRQNFWALIFECQTCGAKVKFDNAECDKEPRMALEYFNRRFEERERDDEIIKAFDILNKFEFFEGQRAGRELWGVKPTEIQEEDIRDFVDDIAFLRDFINRQKAEIERLKAEAEMTEGYAEALEQKARKEFAARLKEKAFVPDLSPTGARVVEEWEIDETLTELKKKGGESDARDFVPGQEGR